MDMIQILDSFRYAVCNQQSVFLETVNSAKELEEACDKINKVVKERSNGLISSMISPRDIDSSALLVIINTIYFKGFVHDCNHYLKF